MSLTSHRPQRRGDGCEVCGGQDCTKFTTTDWPGDAPFRPGTQEQMEAQADEAKSEEDDTPPAAKRGRRANRPSEDRAHHGPEEDR